MSFGINGSTGISNIGNISSPATENTGRIVTQNHSSVFDVSKIKGTVLSSLHNVQKARIVTPREDAENKGIFATLARVMRNLFRNIRTLAGLKPAADAQLKKDVEQFENFTKSFEKIKTFEDFAHKFFPEELKKCANGEISENAFKENILKDTNAMLEQMKALESAFYTLLAERSEHPLSEEEKALLKEAEDSMVIADLMSRTSKRGRTDEEKEDIEIFFGTDVTAELPYKKAGLFTEALNYEKAGQLVRETVSDLIRKDPNEFRRYYCSSTKELNREMVQEIELRMQYLVRLNDENKGQPLKVGEDKTIKREGRSDKVGEDKTIEIKNETAKIEDKTVKIENQRTEFEQNLLSYLGKKAQTEFSPEYRFLFALQDAAEKLGELMQGSQQASGA